MGKQYSGIYRMEYETLGQRLTARDRISQSRIRAAERRLSVNAPPALRDYYQIAGNETRFNAAFNRLLPPEEWVVERGRLVFMEENQAVVLWGVPTIRPDAEDPAVFQGVNGPQIKWYREQPRCSTFLCVMLHWQAAFGGGMPVSATALASVALRRILKHNWRFVGEVNRMQAFSKPGKSVCHLKWDNGWRVFAGAVNQKKMDEIARELTLTWGDPV